MLGLDEYEIVTPRHPIGIALVLSPEEVEFALATNGRSLERKIISTLIAHLIVECDHDAPQQQVTKAG